MHPVRGELKFLISGPRGGSVELSVYSVDGRHVGTVYRGVLAGAAVVAMWKTGQHEPAGVYFARLAGAGGAIVRKVVVLR